MKTTAKILGSLALLILPVGLCFMLALGGVPVRGFGWLNPNVKAKPTATATKVERVNYTLTPALKNLNTVLDALSSTWTPTSVQVQGAGLPYPMNCVSPAPTVALSRSYNAATENAATDVQITLAAYPAGVGAALFSRFANVADCAPPGVQVYTYSVGNLGVEASGLRAQWATNDITTLYFRRGDVVAFVSTKTGIDAAAAAAQVDSLLQNALGNTCAEQNSTSNDANRNAFFAGNDFMGQYRVQELTTAKLTKPALTGAQKQAGVQAINVPGRDLHIVPVQLPNSDVPYPLWPPLPKAVATPQAPPAPRKQTLSSTVNLRIPDRTGPGCGWAFLNTVTPTYNVKEVATVNDARAEQAQATLDADGPRWQRDVSDYWNNYHAYRASIAAYNNYRAQVSIVASAWARIAEQWNQYYTAYANWQAQEQARTDLIAAKAQARQTYRDQREECDNFPALQAQYETEEAQYQIDYNTWQQELAAYNAAYPTLEAQYKEELKTWRHADHKTRGPRPQKPMPPVAPVEPVAPLLTHPCPPVKDPIRKEKVPAKTAPPAKPADPRPASERN